MLKQKVLVKSGETRPMDGDRPSARQLLSSSKLRAHDADTSKGGRKENLLIAGSQQG